MQKMSNVNKTVILIRRKDMKLAMGNNKYFGIYANKRQIFQQVKVV